MTITKPLQNFLSQFILYHFQTTSLRHLLLFNKPDKTATSAKSNNLNSFGDNFQGEQLVLYDNDLILYLPAEDQDIKWRHIK